VLGDGLDDGEKRGGKVVLLAKAVRLVEAVRLAKVVRLVEVVRLEAVKALEKTEVLASPDCNRACRMGSQMQALEGRWVTAA
jgi:hypothetical protein